AIRSELASGRTRAEVARSRYAAPEGGAIKLYLVWTVMNHRKANPELYLSGSYRPLEAAGERKENVVAFARASSGKAVGAVAPRLAAPLMGDAATRPPLGPDVWGDPEVPLPDAAPTRWRDLLTDRTFEPSPRDDRRAFRLADLFAELPLALLAAEGAE